MRYPLAPLLLALFSLCTAAELEQITTTDGRRLVGYYDAASQTMTLEGPPKAVIRLTGDQVADRNPYARAEEKDPVKRDAAALVKLEADRQAAIADATRLRKFATRESGKDSDVALAQANERLAVAETLGKQIDEIQARMPAKAKPAKASAAPANSVAAAPLLAPDVSALPVSGISVIFATADSLRKQADAEERAAVIAWLKTQDLRMLPVPPNHDLRPSEEAARNLIVQENNRREMYKDAIEGAALQNQSRIDASDDYRKRTALHNVIVMLRADIAKGK